MTLDEYAQWATAMAKPDLASRAERLAYAGLGLVGEAGEVADMLRRGMRDGALNEDRLIYELGDELLAKYLAQRKFDEYETLSAAQKFMADELGIAVTVQSGDSANLRDPGKKAKDALPMKPAFFIE